MNKKINYLAVIPIWGSVVLLFGLFIKVIKNKVCRKKFHAYFISCALMGALSIIVTVFFLHFLNSMIDISRFIEKYGRIVAFSIGGYLMNLFTFVLINKSWENLMKN